MVCPKHLNVARTGIYQYLLQYFYQFIAPMKFCKLVRNMDMQPKRYFDQVL